MPAGVVGGGEAQGVGAKLTPVLAVDAPLARALDVFAGGDRGSVADHRHEVLMAGRFQLEDAEAGVRVVVGNPLDQTGQRLGRQGHHALSAPKTHRIGQRTGGSWDAVPL